MRIWVICISTLFVILATLSIAQDMTIQVNTIDNLLIILIVFSSILFIIQKIVYRKLCIFTLSNNLLEKSHSLSTPKLILFLQIIIFLLLLFGSSIYTIKKVKQEVSKDISQSVRVLAKIRPIEISDSFYYPESDMSYRQLGVIESAYPLTLSILEQPNIIDDLSSDLNLLGKRVLLSAHKSSTKIKNNKLPPNYTSNFERLNQLQPSQSAYMLLSLEPISVGEDDFLYRWLRSRHVNATADVLAYQKDFLPHIDTIWLPNRWVNQILHQWRWNLRQYFLYKLSNNWSDLEIIQQQAVAVTLSLLTGDRALISRQTKNLYQLAGISHLLAISGTHVLFLAIILSNMMVKMVNRFHPMMYQYITRSNLRWVTMVFGAFLYALFTGFDVPSARTVYMLVAIGLSKLLLLDVSARQVLLIVAMLMVSLDPYILWQAGFWLSFMAVMLLISYEMNIHKSINDNEDTQSLFQQLMSFIKLQLWMFISLLPLSLLLFGKVSGWGLLINVFAIGFYGWIIIPLNLLAGIAYIFLPSVANVIWALVISLLKTGHIFLFWLTGGNISTDAWIYTDINAGTILIIGLMFLPMLITRGVIYICWSLPPFILLIIIFYNQSQRRHGVIDSQPKLIILDNKFMRDRTYVNSLLLSYSNDQWLILSESNSSKNQKKVQKYSPELAKQLSRNWFDQLKQLGISSLTGIIIQSPSQKLMYTSKSLKSNIPVGYIWMAGSRHLDPSNQFPSLRPCEEGVGWKSKDNMLSITAITGWQEIKDKDVWSCVLQIDADQINLYSQYPLYWIDTVNKQIYNNIESKYSAINLAKSSKLIVNAGDSNKIWQLWGTMCTIDKPTIKFKTIFLTDSYANDAKELIKLNAINLLILLDNPKYNTQNLSERLLEFNNKK